MKKIKITMVIILILVIGFISNVFADTINATADLKIDTSKSYKPGDTITVVLNATCENGLSYIGTEIEYDKDLLTIQSVSCASNFINYASENTKEKIEILVNTSEIVKQSDIYTIVFKINNNAKSGSTKISTKSIEIMDITNSVKNIDKIEKTITIQEATSEVILSSISVSKAPNKLTYKVGEKFDVTGMVITATYSDGSTKAIQGYTYAPTAELTTSDKKITITYTENGITKNVEQTIDVTEKQNEVSNPSNSSSSNSNSSNNSSNNTESKNAEQKNNQSGLPYTGQNTFAIGIIAIAVVAILVVSYKGYIKYREIK